MDLNFFSANESYESTSVPMLKPWGIYKVKFEGCEHTTFKGVKDPNASYNVLKFKFVGDNGQFTETLFEPKDGDKVRPTRKLSNGHEVPQPSLYDNFIKELGQLLTVIAPEVLAKLVGKSASFDAFADAIVKGTNKDKGKEVFIKLIGNKKNQARFPYFLSIFEKDPNVVKITDNFISLEEKKLNFTEYELNQKAKIEQAAPTNMATVNKTTDTADVVVPETPDTENLDLDLLQ